MQLGHLLLEAHNLMFIGMLFVGLFLGILVFLIPLLHTISPDDTPEATPASAITPQLAQQAPDTMIAVISAAIQQYRNQHK